MGQEAIQAPQYMHMPLFTTSVMRLPKIFSFLGSGFQPSPSTLDFNGGGGGDATPFGAAPDVAGTGLAIDGEAAGDGFTEGGVVDTY